MTFDRSVPITEQRLRVACAKWTRKHGKRHSQADHKKVAAKVKRARKQKAVMAKKRAERRRAAALAYWSGAVDELRVVRSASARQESP